MDQVDAFLEKAQEALAGAESEYANGRYNNCANRCYYACFQAAIYALSRAGVRPSSGLDDWEHSFVQSRFVGQLINRRKLYPAHLRETLSRTFALRTIADYTTEPVGQTRSQRMLRLARKFVEPIRTAKGSLEG